MIRKDKCEQEKISWDLKNCGCTPKEIEAYLKLDETDACAQFLKAKRSGLLDKVHQMERHIHTVDYLIYQMESEGKDKRKNGNHQE